MFLLILFQVLIGFLTRVQPPPPFCVCTCYGGTIYACLWSRSSTRGVGWSVSTTLDQSKSQSKGFPFHSRLQKIHFHRRCQSFCTHTFSVPRFFIFRLNRPLHHLLLSYYPSSPFVILFVFSTRPWFSISHLQFPFSDDNRD